MHAKTLYDSDKHVRQNSTMAEVCEDHPKRLTNLHRPCHRKSAGKGLARTEVTTMAESVRFTCHRKCAGKRKSNKSA